MRKLLVSVLATCGLAMTAGVASAQGFGIEVYDGEPVYGYAPYGSYYYGYGPSYGYTARAPSRTYGYRSYGYVPQEREVRRRSGTCGTYFFWNGDRCVDARSK